MSVCFRINNVSFVVWSNYILGTLSTFQYFFLTLSLSVSLWAIKLIFEDTLNSNLILYFRIYLNLLASVKMHFVKMFCKICPRFSRRSFHSVLQFHSFSIVHSTSGKEKGLYATDCYSYNGRTVHKRNNPKLIFNSESLINIC